ncbi:MAG: DUF11 domain-containing protein, partial [Methanobacterium sp.]|nr:DUF11 domain-containing protein [Methanobacterium sp.]
NNTVFVFSNETNLTGNLTDNTTTVVNTTSALNVTKSAPVEVTAGQSEPVVFTITVTNFGPSDALNVKVSDTLDSRLTNQEYSLDDVSWFAWSSPFEYIFDRVNAGQTVLFYLRGLVPSNATGLINNTVFVSSNETNLTGNLTDNTTTMVNTTADLAVTKSGPDTVIAGNNITYNVILINNGPSDSQSVVFNDMIPSWIYNVTYSAVSNTHHEHDSSGVWTSPLSWTTLFANEIITITFNGTVNASTLNGTILNNTANVTAFTHDPNLDNNNDTKITNVTTLASLTITKTAVTEGSDVNHVVSGYPIHYTIVITNEGPSDALNVTFDDYYTPDLLEDTYYSTSNGIPWTAYINPLNITNLIDRLAPGQNVTIWINGTVISNATQGLNNTAGTSSETDPEGRKTASVYNDIQTAHVTIEKTVSNTQPYIHETIHFTLIVQNWGPDTAINVYAVDKLPTGVKYVSSVANYGSYDPTTGIWTIGNLPYGSIAQLVITVVVEKLGPIENHAHIYTDSYDPILAGHNASASIYVQEQPQSGNNTIGMQNTGVPLPSLILALFLVLTGLSMVVTRKK